MFEFRKMCFLTVAIAFAVVVAAQDRADVLVSYEESAFGGKHVNKMNLLANTGQSKYFNEVSLWTDSLTSTPEGKAKHEEIIRANCLVRDPEGYDSWDLTKPIVKKIDMYVFNSVADGELTVYDEWGEEPMYYTEDADEMQWTVVPDSVSTMLGYDCILAESDYHGRKWRAWFAPEIPLPFGPWKLHGLPGLILKADADGGFSFMATGLQTTDRLITPMYSASDYSRTERKKAQAQHEHYINNMEAMLKAEHEGLVKITFSDDEGNPIDAPRYDAKKESLEPDYKE